jgi:hypothetical protein
MTVHARRRKNWRRKAGGKIFSGKKLVDVPDLLHNKQPDIAT